MKRFLFLLAFSAAVIAPLVIRAQTTLGEVVATFPVDAAKLLADPLRNRVYAVVSASNSLVVIDTTTFQTTTITVGSEPVDLSISPDDTTLYTANSGSSTAAISVVDLNTLTAGPAITLPGAAQTVVAGPAGYLYVTLANSNYTFQVNTATGASQTIFGNAYDYQPLQLGPDGKTLYVNGNSLETFDVSTGTPTLLLTSYLYTGDGQFDLSHNGKYFCLPDGSNSGVTSDSTSLYSAADLSSVYGSFSNNNTPGPLVFSLDDSLVYQFRSGTKPVLDVFSTQNFAQVQEVSLSAGSGTNGVEGINSLIIDRTGSYLFVSENYYDSDYNYVYQTVAITTGTGTLTPPSFLPTITSSLTATGTEYTPFTYQITASNTPTSFNATNLPTGLSVNSATGLISGTVSDTFGTFDVQISATNASGTATATLALEIDYSSLYTIPVITNPSLPGGVVGQVYSATISATGLPNYFYADNLPPGLIIGPYNGVISGTPTQSGVYSVYIEASNEYDTGSTTLSLTISDTAVTAPMVNSATAATLRVGSSYSYQITATNLPSSFAASGLPAGLSLNTTTGLISGAATTAGIFSVTLSATNAGGTGTATLTLTVTALPTSIIALPATLTTNAGVAFSYQIVASNNPTGFTAIGLPAGLSVDASTGLISGTPTTTGTFSVSIGVTNLGGTSTATVALTVATLPLPVITPPVNLTAMVGQAFSYQILASNDSTAYVAGNLPSGLAVDGTTGLITGTPLVAGTSNVAISVTNASGTTSATFALAVAPGLPTVTLLATVPRATVGSGDYAAITISRTGDLTQKLVVSYAIKGGAKNGADYFTLTGKQKIKANKASATIQIIPLDTFSGEVSKTVKVTLLQSGRYTLGNLISAKAKIVPAGQ